MSNYIYPQVTLPDIDTVWTDKETYPYAAFAYMDMTDIVENYAGYLMCLSTTPFIIKDGYPMHSASGQMKVFCLCLTEENADTTSSSTGWSVVAGEWAFVHEEPVDETEYVGIGDPIWTSHDILNEDGTTYLSAYTPVKVKNDMVVYMGMERPDINSVWTDELKAQYPYAYMYEAVGFDLTGVVFTSFEMYRDGRRTLAKTAGSMVYASHMPPIYDNWQLDDEVTEVKVDDIMFDLDADIQLDKPFHWTSHDILNEDGSVYLAASEPIPVNPVTPSKPFCLRSWLTGFALGLAGKAIPFVKEYPQPDDPFPIEWNNMAIKNNTSIELEGTSVFKISDSIPTSDELTNCIIVGSNSEMGSLTFAFNSVENIGSIDVFLYTYKYAAEAIPVWILRVSENTDGYEPGLYFLDVFEDISVDYAMHYITFCLYNGVKMPDIETVWVDKQKYPYAFMEAEVSDNGTIARLYLTANPVQINASELSGLRIPAGGWVQYVCTTDPNIVVSVVGYNHWKDNMMTGENDMSFDAPEESGIAWANYDVFNTDGTLYLAASEPVPIYE